MNLLLGSHIFVWWRAGERTLSRTGDDAIAAPVDTVHVSLATAWELASRNPWVGCACRSPSKQCSSRAGFLLLPVRLDHVRAVTRLPFHHRDAFDRMLVAQAQHEGFVLVSADRPIARYDVPVPA